MDWIFHTGRFGLSRSHGAVEEGVGSGLMDHACQVRVSHTYLALLHPRECKVSQQRLCDALSHVHALMKILIPIMLDPGNDWRNTTTSCDLASKFPRCQSSPAYVGCTRQTIWSTICRTYLRSYWCRKPLMESVFQSGHSGDLDNNVQVILMLWGHLSNVQATSGISVYWYFYFDLVIDVNNCSNQWW